MVKALLILKIFKFLSSVFGQVEKRLDKKGKANFKIYDIMTLLTIAIHIAQDLTK